MEKTKFLELAEAASRASLEEMEYSMRACIIARQLGCERYNAPGLESFTPTAFYAAVETGGASGGNYGESSAEEYAVAPQDADHFDALDSFLEEHFPLIPFLAYRKLTRRMEKVKYSDREYYGNRTDYAIRILAFETLWTVLEEAGLTVEATGGLYR